jgi:hypothetical protein
MKHIYVNTFAHCALWAIKTLTSDLDDQYIETKCHVFSVPAQFEAQHDIHENKKLSKMYRKERLLSHLRGTSQRRYSAVLRLARRRRETQSGIFNFK